MDSTIVDHSPNHPTKAGEISTASKVVLIDNYDSFTWNVYQYLVLEGATVNVIRNDQVTLEELIKMRPTQLVISPGPGHPDTDSGISKPAILYFAGKIPIFGVCMGQQCMISCFGGVVDVTGEILHGKTSSLSHDSKGVYAGLPPNFSVTRYHSLAGTRQTIPECLEISSKTELGTGSGDTVIMGVRHKEFTVEGVQFHPESILTEHGRRIFGNFLRLQSSAWQDAPTVTPKPTVINAEKAKGRSVLDQIYAHRKLSVEKQKTLPSQRPEDLCEAYSLGIALPLISFPDRLRQSDFPISLMAEIKRASPSKGIIAASACASAQARMYAKAGASVISVLTEPEWFRGSIEDLRMVRHSLEGFSNRPAVLRKEFVFDEYQILEARLAGADTVLLIVKMLKPDVLKRLYEYSRKLEMEPLVEVNTPEEMEVAIALGAKVIGINNRDLTSFEVDLGTTSRLLDKVPKETIICALSGIRGPKDVELYSSQGVRGILVGEALMRAPNITAFISDLLGGKKRDIPSSGKQPPLVKICGTRTSEAARTAIHAGADLIGIIQAANRARTVSDDIALDISRTVKTAPRPTPIKQANLVNSVTARDYFEHAASELRHPTRALLVGVFFNQPLSYILCQQKKLDLDIVQLHGSEPIEWANLIPVPVIKKFAPLEQAINTRGYHALPLLDSGSGGTGVQLASTAVQSTLQKDNGLQIVLAGGMNPTNLEETICKLGNSRGQIACIDVSSGIETNGQQDLEKIKSFVAVAKSLQL